MHSDMAPSKRCSWADMSDDTAEACSFSGIVLLFHRISSSVSQASPWDWDIFCRNYMDAFCGLTVSTPAMALE